MPLQPNTYTDRYLRVGLRANPFAVPATTPLMDRDIDNDVEALFVSRGLPDPPPPGMSTLVQVIGDQGAGKTTHVRHWRTHTPGPYYYVPRSPYTGRWKAPPIEAIVYADEIDRMPRPLRRWWFNRLGQAQSTVVAGTHADLTALARRAGLKVITHQLGPVPRETLDAIITARLESVAIDGETTFRFLRRDLERIFEKSHGSVREAESFCHELLAERVL